MSSRIFIFPCIFPLVNYSKFALRYTAFDILDFNNNKIKTLKVMGRKLKSSKKKYREIVDNVLSEEKVKINRYLKCNLGSDHIGLVCRV